MRVGDYDGVFEGATTEAGNTIRLLFELWTTVHSKAKIRMQIGGCSR